MNTTAMLRAFCDAVEQRNGEAFADLFTEDGVYHGVFYGTFTGRANVAGPERKSASMTLMRRPSRTSRAGTKSSAPWRCSITKAKRPMMTRPCSEFGSQGPRAASVGMKASRSVVKKG